MMNADDECTQMSNLSLDSSSGPISATEQTAPPTSNHFQPIAAQSTDASTPSLIATSTALLPPPPPLPSPLTDPSNSPLVAPKLAKPSALIKPPPPPSSSGSPSTFTPLPVGTTPPPPPSAAAAAAATTSSFVIPPAPPSTLPPPPTASSGIHTSLLNPYSAKGAALNRKVYDSNLVSVAPTAAAGAPPPVAVVGQSVEPVAPNLFIPPPMPVTVETSPNIADSAALLPASSSFGDGFGAPPGVQAMNIDVASAADPNQQQPSAAGAAALTAKTSPPNKTMWTWFKSGIATSIEKAKHSVETIVTTVDPQMKEYIHPANKPILLVSSISHAKLIHTVRESFNDAGFSKITMSGVDIPTSTPYAPQVVGFANAVQAAREKLDNTAAYVQHNECIVLAFQDFLAELTTDCWFELAVVMLRDKANNIELTVYTDATPVPLEDIAQLNQLTPGDYPLRWSGWSCRLPEKNFNFGNQATSSLIAYETPDSVLSQMRTSSTLKTLAVLLKNRLLKISA